MTELGVTGADLEGLFKVNETAKLQLESIITSRLLVEALAEIETLRAQINGANGVPRDQSGTRRRSTKVSPGKPSTDLPLIE